MCVAVLQIEWYAFHLAPPTDIFWEHLSLLILFSDRTDQFFLQTKSVGPIQKILLRHDNTGTNPSWYIDKIYVEDMESMMTYEFPAEQWIATDHSDGALQREFFALGITTVAIITYTASNAP